MALQAPSPWRPPPEWETHLPKSLERPSTSTTAVPSSESSSSSSPRQSSPLGSARTLSHLFSPSGSVASFFSTISSLASSSPSTPSDEDSPDATKSAPSRLPTRHPKRPAMFVRRSTSAVATLPTLSSRAQQEQGNQRDREAQQRKRASAPPGHLAASAAAAGLTTSTVGGELSNWMDAVTLVGRQVQASKDEHEVGGT
ncbi:hypothetical protein JCM3775_002434 [Rhodotorula graminis]